MVSYHLHRGRRVFTRRPAKIHRRSERSQGFVEGVGTANVGIDDRVTGNNLAGQLHSSRACTTSRYLVTWLFLQRYTNAHNVCERDVRYEAGGR